ncbi:MAG: DMT family transporter [Alphaproteobacteria bacterium]
MTSWFNTLPGTVRGPIYMVLGGVSLTLMMVVIRDMADKFSVLEMIFLRSVITFLLILPWAIRQGVARLRTKRAGLHLFRNVIHYLGNIGWFLGVTLVPMADVQSLQFTVPLFVIIMAALVLRETVGFNRWVAVATGFVGALIIIRPGLVEISLGTVAVLTSAICYASSQTATKALSRTEHPNTILFFMAIIYLPVSGIPAAFDWVTPGWADIGPIFLLGLTGYVAHTCLIRSFAAADASYVIPFDFVRLPVAAAMGYVLYLEAVDPWTWAGAVVIFAATWYTTYAESARGKAETKP